jgi:hypothetical protein
MKYKKKPIVIEAELWDGSMECFDMLCIWAPDDTLNLFTDRGGNLVLEIKTLEGTMKAMKGDFIIKGIANEMYPCKSEIFTASYLLVQE